MNLSFKPKQYFASGDTFAPAPPSDVVQKARLTGRVMKELVAVLTPFLVKHVCLLVRSYASENFEYVVIHPVASTGAIHCKVLSTSQAFSFVHHRDETGLLSSGLSVLGVKQRVEQATHIPPHMQRVIREEHLRAEWSNLRNSGGLDDKEIVFDAGLVWRPEWKAEGISQPRHPLTKVVDGQYRAYSRVIGPGGYQFDEAQRQHARRKIGGGAGAGAAGAGAGGAGAAAGGAGSDDDYDGDGFADGDASAAVLARLGAGAAAGDGFGATTAYLSLPEEHEDEVKAELARAKSDDSLFGGGSASSGGGGSGACLTRTASSESAADEAAEEAEGADRFETDDA